MKKYELVADDSIEYEGRTLYRIRALKDFEDVKIGDLGGYVESEDNLSQTGNAWVYDKAMVFDNARVSENAQVKELAMIYDNAEAFGNAKIFGCAWVYGNAKIYGNAKADGSAEICGKAQVYGNALVDDNAHVYGNAKVCGDYVLLGAMVAEGNVSLGEPIEIYYNDLAYAQKADERDKYFASLDTNKKCANAIDRLISENHDGQHFDYDKVVDSIIKEFGAERVAVILAIQIQEHGSWDGRYSNENKNWAKSVRLPEKRDLALYANGVQCVHLTAHPILIDKVVSEVREYLSKSEHDTSNKKTPKTNDLCEH